MRNPVYGVHIADHKSLGHKVLNCFLGSEAVDWLYENLQLDKRAHAINICQRLKIAELFRTEPEDDKSSKCIEFSEAKLYKFEHSKIDKWKDIYKSFQEEDTSDVPNNIFADQTIMTDLSARDWGLLMAGGSSVVYSKGDVIVKQGQTISDVYRVRKGMVRMVRKSDDKTIVVHELGLGNSFCELSVLEVTEFENVNAIAGDDGAEVCIIPVDFMISLFGSEPGLSKRFYARLAMKLASKYKFLLSLPSDVDSFVFPALPEQMPTREETTKPQDTSFQNKFGLPESELLIRESQCVKRTRTAFHLSGTLYISSHYFCFLAKVFGYDRKYMIKIVDIQDIKLKSENCIKLITSDKEYQFFNLSDAENFVHLVETMRSAQKGSSSNLRVFARGPHSRSHSRASNVDMRKFEELTKDDWKMILNGFLGVRVVVYKPNTFVVCEGKSYHQIFQVARGTCTAVKRKSCSDATSLTPKSPRSPRSPPSTHTTHTLNTPPSKHQDTPEDSNTGSTLEDLDGMELLGEIKEGEIFGEIWFMDGGASSMSIITGSQGADIYIIEKYFINVLFVRLPRLAGRFYRYLCQILANRIAQRENTIYHH
eukprot:TRINITY_DN7083_c0_g1_i1.p1 TRINITY_DN7083_c0_g1~~TRINITY_DN7083_c0_g1_i1.p1  ORF type:complete len:595 (-),score=80.48 TRINITY_DN7083_c0_g1_i1:254-2038(-)